MVQAMVRISDEANQILNIVKAKFNLNDKSEAIDLVVKKYGEDLLEPQLKPQFIERMKKRQDEPTVKISDFGKHFN
jgi:hypothetical protein